MVDKVSTITAPPHSFSLSLDPNRINKILEGMFQGNFLSPTER